MVPAQVTPEDSDDSDSDESDDGDDALAGTGAAATVQPDPVPIGALSMRLGIGGADDATRTPPLHCSACNFPVHRFSGVRWTHDVVYPRPRRNLRLREMVCGPPRTSWPRRRRDPPELLARISAVAASAEYPRRGRGAAATRLRGIPSQVQLNRREWRTYGAWDSDQFSRVLLAETSAFNMFLVAWERGNYSPVHDHAGSASWTKVLEGTLDEAMYGMGPDGLRLARAGPQGEGSVTYANDDLVHGCVAATRCFTLSLYSPPYTVANAFVDDGSSTVRVEIPTRGDRAAALPVGPGFAMAFKSCPSVLALLWPSRGRTPAIQRYEKSSKAVIFDPVAPAGTSAATGRRRRTSGRPNPRCWTSAPARTPRATRGRGGSSTANTPTRAARRGRSGPRT